MDWLLDVGTFHCERDDCPGGPKPCSFCHMPAVTHRVDAVMALYNRCHARRCLPYSGGVMDQPEGIMRDFDVIDDRVAAFRKRQAENAERERALGAIREGLRG